MGYSVYSIHSTPDGKFRLYQYHASLGVFDTLEKARIGLKLAIKPEVYYFDAEGNEVEAS
jgi:hypothetical protein